ncbi:MAG: aminotransferase class I/II-fold pyridoxal phosphate-dependent enzyme [Pseudomonadota bacterium]
MIVKANMLRKAGLYPFFRAIEQTEGSTVVVNGKKQIMIGSNNYLGLTHHPEVKAAAIRAIEKYGTGCTGSRFLNGNLVIHEELEEKLAKFIGHEAALVFSTGMQSNLGAISAICGSKDCILSDQENHASIIDANRLAPGPNFKFKHNNMESLEEQLVIARKRFQNILIVADGVFSMTGDVINLPEMVRLAKKYNAMVYIDDAHGLGVLGPQGRGTINHFGLIKDVDFNMGTFSKSFASIGGFVSGSRDSIDYLKHMARSFMFSASMPPPAVATACACLDLILRDDSCIKKLWDNVHFVKKGFQEIGLYTYNTQSSIIPVFIGDDIKAMQVTKYLEERGVFATPVIPPAVPPGESLIRTSYMATHRREDLQYVIEVFADAKKKFDIPTNHHTNLFSVQ